jgi:DME family drug/metabolite transporter
VGGAAAPDPGPAPAEATGGSSAVVDVLLAAVLFGSTGTAQALGPAATTPVTVGAARLVVGSAGLVAAALVGAGPLDRRRCIRRMLALLRSPAALLCAVAVAGYQVGFFAGVARAGVAAGTLVTLGCAPFLAGLLAWLLDRHRPTRVWFTATGVAVAGLALVTAGGATGGSADRSGLWASVGAALAYATYAVVTKRLIAAGARPTEVMAVVFSVGAVLLAPFLVAGPTAWLATPRGAELALYLGLVPTTVAYVLFGRGLSRLAASTAATLNLAEPVVAGLLGVLALHEDLATAGAVGMALVVAALAMLSRSAGSDPEPGRVPGEIPWAGESPP